MWGFLVFTITELMYFSLMTDNFHARLTFSAWGFCAVDLPQSILNVGFVSFGGLLTTHFLGVARFTYRIMAFHMLCGEHAGGSTERLLLLLTTSLRMVAVSVTIITLRIDI